MGKEVNKHHVTVNGIKVVWENCSGNLEEGVSNYGSIKEVTFEECPIEQIDFPRQRRRKGMLPRGNK